MMKPNPALSTLSSRKLDSKNIMNITIGHVKDSDFDQLSQIYCDAYNSLNIGEQWDHASAQKLLRHLHKAQPDLFFVASCGEKIVGAITAIIKPWWDGNHLTDGELFVDPKSQSKGAGRLLIKALFAKAFDVYNAVSWDTFTHRVHEHPLSWYKKLGFKEIEQWVMIEGDVKKVLRNLK